MQMCLSTSTMPSARLNEAPVGQTSTQGGSAQCWHITGTVFSAPVFGSRTCTLRIHCASVAGRRARFYSLTKKGRQALRRELARWDAHAQAVYAVLGEVEG